jgi:hypothetical protein
MNARSGPSDEIVSGPGKFQLPVPCSFSDESDLEQWLHQVLLETASGKFCHISQCSNSRIFLFHKYVSSALRLWCDDEAQSSSVFLSTRGSFPSLHTVTSHRLPFKS